MNKKLARPSVVVLVALAIVSGTVALGLGRAQAEQSGGSPESGSTSNIKSLYTTLQGLSYGSDTASPDWGTLWDRVKTAATWTPSGTAAAGNVLSGYTFYGASRTSGTGTYVASNLSPATVKSGTSFGVGQTGAYPSSSNPLAGDTGSDAAAGNVKSGLVAWDKTGSLISGTYPAPAACPTEAYHDNYGAPATQTTNCTAGITWTTNPSPAAGDDTHGMDPVTGVTWSQALWNNSGTLAFSTTGNSSWTWNGTSNFTVTSANATAGATYTNNGQTFTVVTILVAGTTLTVTATGSPAASGTLTKASGTGDATITFSSISNGAANAAMGGKTAKQLCTAMGGSWRLPTQKELMQAYIDGSNFDLSQPSNNFWSATEGGGGYAWGVYLANGNTYGSVESNQFQVRCVR